MRPRDLAALEFDHVRDTLAQFACSSAAKEACRALTPSPDRATVEERLEATWQCFRLIEQHGNLPLLEFPDIRAALRTAAHEGFALDGRSLVDIRTVLETAQQTRAFLKKHTASYPALAQFQDRLVPLRDLEVTLARALDESGAITDDASDELAEVRRTLRHLRDKLTRRLDDLVSQPVMAEMISDRYVTIRNNRFVVPIRTAMAAQFGGVVQDRSGSGETAFIEPLFAVELNNRLLMAAKEEEALVRRILGDLTALVRDAHATIDATFSALVDIDALAARARLAQRYHCVQPQLDDDELTVRQAQQPLLLFAGRDVVPIDLLLPRGKSVLVVSGPNTGGKTVALKTMGLMALMAQSGLLIPAAEGSRLPCFRGIYADVGDEQSIERNLSTFSAHVANLTEIIDRHESPALVLLDEPGVGTDPDDGAALGIGMIETLAASGVRLAVSTHYAPIKVFALSDDRCVTAAVEFDLESITARYRLIYHSIGESLALPIARRLGLPETVLRVAEAARTEQAKALGAAVSRLEESRRGYEERTAEADQRVRSTARAQQEADQLLAELREKRRQRWSEELNDARAFVRNLREQGRELLAEIERGAADRRALNLWVQKQEATIGEKQAAVSTPTPPDGPPPGPPQIGDQVEIGETGMRGELLAVEGERAWMQRGSLRFEVPAAQLRRVEGRPRPAVEVRVPAPPEDAAQDVTLLGLRAKEAVEQLIDFLDRATRAGYPAVRIIHGVGTGALKRAVHEYLSSSPYCARFRSGGPHEGGAGVTIAELASR
jgi:DNA mismatch repair protein MutS2